MSHTYTTICDASALQALVTKFSNKDGDFALALSCGASASNASAAEALAAYFI